MSLIRNEWAMNTGGHMVEHLAKYLQSCLDRQLTPVNGVILLGYLYNLQIIDGSLMAGFIASLLHNFNDRHVELVLKTLTISGYPFESSFLSFSLCIAMHPTHTHLYQ